MIRTLQILCLLIILIGCTSRGDAGRSAQDIIPDLSENYLSPDVARITDALVDTGLTTVAIAGQPIFASQIGVINGFTECMTERTGAVSMRFYVHREFPTVAGMALVINRDRLLSIENVLRCLLPQNNLVSESSFNPCLNAWEYREDGVTYYMMYAGTAQLICNELQAALPRNTGSANVQSFVPDLAEEYDSPDVTSMVDALGDTTTSNTMIIQQVSVIDSFAQCMSQQAETSFMRFYVNRENPDVVGMALVINRNQIIGTENTISCLDPRNHLVSETSINPCYGTREYQDGNGIVYYMMYTGTAQLICEALENTLPQNT